jgi:Ribosomal protein L3
MTTKGILGKKVGMTQVFTDAGELIPVTVVEATPNVVLQVKTMENDGYEAIQLGYQDKREVLSNKPEQGHVAKANTTPKRFIREFRDVELGDYKVADEVKVDVFQQATSLMSLVSLKVMDTKVTFIKTVKAVALWPMVLVTTVVQVLWVPSSTGFSLVRSSQVGWVTSKLRSKTCKS